MKGKTTLIEKYMYPTVDGIFNHPLEFVSKLQNEHWKNWLPHIVIALLGYAVFGLSISSSETSSLNITAILLFPFLFLAAQLVSLPALYIFNAFLGSQLTPKEILAAGLIALVVPGVLLAGMAPIHWFFSISTNSSNMLSWVQKGCITIAAVIGYIEVQNTLPQVEEANPGSKPKQLNKQEKMAIKSKKRQRKRLLYAWLFLYLGVLYKLAQVSMPKTWMIN